MPPKRKPLKVHPFGRKRALTLLSYGLSIKDTVSALSMRHPGYSVAQVKQAYFPKYGAFVLHNLEGASREEIVKKMNMIEGFRKRGTEHLKRLHKDPAFAAANRERSSKRIRRLNNDPTIRKKLDAHLMRLNKSSEARKRNSIRITRLNKSPEGRERSRIQLNRLRENPAFVERARKGASEAITRLHNDPAFAARHRARASATFIKLRKDPAFNAKMLAGISRRWNTHRQRLLDRAEELGVSTTWDRDRDGNWSKIAVDVKTPLKKILTQERKNVIQKALNSLTLLEQNVMYLTFGLFEKEPSSSFEEISATLDLPLSSVTRAFKRALNKLKKIPDLKNLL